MRVTKTTAVLCGIGIVLTWIGPAVQSVVVWLVASAVMSLAVGNHISEVGIRPALARRSSRPGKQALMSTAEFAEDCAKRLTVKAEPEPEPPDALPAGLRGDAFNRD